MLVKRLSGAGSFLYDGLLNPDEIAEEGPQQHDHKEGQRPTESRQLGDVRHANPVVHDRIRKRFSQLPRH